MVDLCPPDSCVYAQLTFSDWHDQLVQDGVYWFLEDPLGGNRSAAACSRWTV